MRGHASRDRRFNNSKWTFCAWTTICLASLERVEADIWRRMLERQNVVFENWWIEKKRKTSFTVVLLCHISFKRPSVTWEISTDLCFSAYKALAQIKMIFEMSSWMPIFFVFFKHSPLWLSFQNGLHVKHLKTDSHRSFFFRNALRSDRFRNLLVLGD